MRTRARQLRRGWSARLLAGAHLEYAELPLGPVVFDLEASREIRPKAKAGLLSWLDLLLDVVAVQVYLHRPIRTKSECHAVVLVDGYLGRSHLAVLDGDGDRPVAWHAGGGIGAQQEEQPAKDEYDHHDQDYTPSQCSSILREACSLSSSLSQLHCRVASRQRFSRCLVTYLMRPSVSMV